MHFIVCLPPAMGRTSFTAFDKIELAASSRCQAPVVKVNCPTPALSIDNTWQARQHRCPFWRTKALSRGARSQLRKVFTSIPSLMVLVLASCRSAGACVLPSVLLLLVLLIIGGQVQWVFPHLTTPCYLLWCHTLFSLFSRRFMASRTRKTSRSNARLNGQSGGA